MFLNRGIQFEEKIWFFGHDILALGLTEIPMMWRVIIFALMVANFLAIMVFEWVIIHRWEKALARKRLQREQCLR